MAQNKVIAAIGATQKDARDIIGAVDATVVANSLASANAYTDAAIAGLTLDAPLKYWVGPAGQLPDTLYHTPQAANDAAITDGHGPANPATLFLLPGTYVGNVILSDGISMHGFSIPDSVGDTVIVGNVSASSSVICAMSQFFVRGRVILGSGAATSASYTMRNVTIIPTIGAQVPLTLNDPTAKFLFYSVSGDGNTAIANAVETVGAANNIFATGCEFLAPIGKRGLHLAGAVTSLYCEATEIQSGVDYGGAVTAIFDNCEFEMSPGVAALISFAGSHTTFHVCSVSGLLTGDQFVAGSGEIHFDSLTGINAITIAPTISGQVLYVQKAYSTYSPAGGANVTLLTLADLVRVNNGGGGGSFNCILPSSKTIPQGTRSAIKNTGASAMVVKADPGTVGDNIDGAASINISTQAGSVILQLEGQTWTTFSRS